MLAVNELSARGLRPVSFTLAAGECIALQGRSGSGKSLFLRALADLDPSQGSVKLDGIERNDVTGPAWRRQVCYLATDAGWWAPKVGDHFGGDHFLADRGWSEALSALELAEECFDWPVGRLSNGEKQRLALLRALAIEPKILLLDEPTSALDDGATRAVETLVDGYRRRGMAVIWVSHDDAQAARVGDRLFAIRDGEVSMP